MSAVPIMPAVLDYTARLVGKACWRVGASYGDQLTLEIGGRRKLKPRSNREYGDWSIESQGSDWAAVRVNDGSVLASSGEPIADGVAKLRVLVSAKVSTAIVTESLSLHLRFDNNIELTFRRPADPDVRYWSILGPDDTILVAGPQHRCEIRRSDVPMMPY